jgi:spore coat protein U-like protein
MFGLQTNLVTCCKRNGNFTNSMETMMNRKSLILKKIIPGMLGLAFAYSGSSLAATETSDLGVSATVTANCTITTTAVSFGTYDPIVTHASDALESTGTVTTTCTNGAAATITLGQGANADTGSTDAAPVRRMISGTDYLGYQLYSDSARTTVWGNDATTDVAVTGTGGAVDTTVYGSVPGGQNVPAGSYADTVVATVTF